MTRLIGHVRGNVIAYLALFCALGGSSYAAISLPKNSVGTKQLRNGAVTQKKFDAHSIPGYVAFWARINTSGGVLASSASATTLGWSGAGGNIVFHAALPRNCFPLANATEPSGADASYISSVESSSVSGRTEIGLTFHNVLTQQSPPLAVDVAEICP
jgi:hypothetical protein